ncbi:MAG: hypothetical protein WC497_03145 [Patescibacteria group bacterium]
MIFIGQFFEILAIDRQKTAAEFQLPSFELPEIDYAGLAINGAMWLAIFLAFFMLSRMIFHIYKLAVAGADDENREMAKDNIKKNIGFFLLASLSWMALSFFQHGISQYF